jgi:UDP-2,4-diacetamido-2,4,6-trideoxy-beta-L-altropyranose hydrolase
MNIVFRVDSSNIIGTGHVFRCLNLAYQYKEHNISFICKNHNYNLNYKISENYKVYELTLDNKENITLDINTWLGESQIDDFNKTIKVIKNNNLLIDWLIIDHYGIDKIWEDKIQKYVKNICVIDDFTNRKHNCNILLNQQITLEEGILKYKNIINDDCKLYCGNDYLLLHQKYFNYINFEKKFENNIKRINIFMGGADNDNITEKIIDICNIYNKNKNTNTNTNINNIEKINYDIIIGSSNKNYQKLKDKIEKLKNFNIYYNLEFIGDLFGEADLCIGAPGGTSYERVLMKVPSLCICIAENQKTVIDKFIKEDVIKYLGTINDNYQDKLLEYLDYFNNNINELKKMSINCNNFINLKNNKIKDILY